MLSNSHFYYRLLRKYIITFGNMFNNITLKQLDTNGTEIKRTKVPILYGPKDKYVVRYEQDPDLTKDTQITLPRMSFEVTGMQYDAKRKQNSLLRIARGNSATRVSSTYMSVPYDMSFELNIYAKNIDDNNQILEQILPYFNPDYTPTIEPIPELDFLKDIPIILDNVVTNIQYESNYEGVRYVYTTLNFTLKGHFYGPTTTPKIIRKSIANIFNDPSLATGYVIRINLAEPGNNGIFKLQDTVFQGSNYQTATAYGTVLDWNDAENKLMIGSSQGNFTVNSTIRALSTNATYNISSFDVSPLKLTKIVVEPDPLTAEPEDDFGYSVSTTEFPDTLE